MRPDDGGELDKPDFFGQSAVVVFRAHAVDFGQWAVGTAHVDGAKVASLQRVSGKKLKGGEAHTERDMP